MKIQLYRCSILVFHYNSNISKILTTNKPCTEYSNCKETTLHMVSFQRSRKKQPFDKTSSSNKNANSYFLNKFFRTTATQIND